MNKKVIEYKMATGRGDYKSIEKKVNKLIAEGWQPIGNVHVNGLAFYQAMVKYEA